MIRLLALLALLLASCATLPRPAPAPAPPCEWECTTVLECRPPSLAHLPIICTEGCCREEM